MAGTRLYNIDQETREQLHRIWDEVGLSNEERNLQLETLESQIVALYRDKVADETALKDEYVSEEARLREDIRIIADRIGKTEEFDEDALNEELHEKTLMERLIVLRGRYEELDNEKVEMLDKIEMHRKELNELCEELGEPLPDGYEDVGFILVGQADNFKEQVLQMRTLRANRVLEMQQLISDISALISELELEVTSEIDRSIMDEMGASLGLHKDTWQLLSERAMELTEEKKRRTAKLKDLGGRIQPLWEKLGVDNQQRQQFFSKNDGMGLRVIEECETELNRLLELKRVKMKDLVENTKKQIQTEYEELRMGNAERSKYDRELPRFDENTSEEQQERVLTAHEEILHKLKEKKERMAPLFKSVDRYHELVEERTKYDELIMDSSRLLSRKGGSQLREEEQLRKRVTKELPRLIAKLKENVATYEAEHGPFMIQGQRFLTEVLEKTENAYTDKRKAAKAKRLQGKQLEEDVASQPQQQQENSVRKPLQAKNTDTTTTRPRSFTGKRSNNSATHAHESAY